MTMGLWDSFSQSESDSIQIHSVIKGLVGCPSPILLGVKRPTAVTLCDPLGYWLHLPGGQLGSIFVLNNSIITWQPSWL